MAQPLAVESGQGPWNLKFAATMAWQLFSTNMCLKIKQRNFYCYTKKGTLPVLFVRVYTALETTQSFTFHHASLIMPSL